MTSSPRHAGAICVSSPPHAASIGLSLTRLTRSVRDILLGLAVSLCVAAFVYAEEMAQGWVPEAQAFPADAEVQMDRAIGSSIRMFSFTTGADVGKLFETWSSALDREGYAIRPQPDDLDAMAIEFSGRHILNGKIATDVASAEGRVLITFDATLE